MHLDARKKFYVFRRALIPLPICLASCFHPPSDRLAAWQAAIRRLFASLDMRKLFVIKQSVHGWMCVCVCVLFYPSRCVQTEQLMSQCYFIDRSWFSAWWWNVYLPVSRIGHSKRWETSPRIDDRAWNERRSIVVLAEETWIRADVRLEKEEERNQLLIARRRQRVPCKTSSILQ